MFRKVLAQRQTEKDGNPRSRSAADQRPICPLVNTKSHPSGSKVHSTTAESDGKHLVVGDYAIEKVLGQGTWGTCFRARHQSTAEIFSLRIISSRLSTSELTALQVAASLVSEVESDRVQQPGEVGLCSGSHFLTSQFIFGEDVFRLVKRAGRLSVRQSIYCIARVIEGLDTAHKKGIVHGELRPSKIVVDRLGAVAIRDLTLAQLIQGRKQKFTDSQTQLNSIPKQHLGYIAPEILSSLSKPNFSSDLYSLGCILYFLLTGKPPYEFRSPKRTLNAHKNSVIPRASLRTKGIPPELDSCLERMLAKRPSDRFASYKQCHEVLRDINKALPQDSLSSAQQWKETFKGAQENASNDWNSTSSSFRLPFVRITLAVVMLVGLISSVWYMTSTAKLGPLPDQPPGVRDVPTSESEDSFIIR